MNPQGDRRNEKGKLQTKLGFYSSLSHVMSIYFILVQCFMLHWNFRTNHGSFKNMIIEVVLSVIYSYDPITN